MSTFAERVRRVRGAKRASLEARYPSLRPPPSPQPVAPPTITRTKRIVLGRDSRGLPLSLDEMSRREHMHVIGTTGAGKTNLIEHMARQDILNDRGALVVDAHGNHPDSVFRRLLTWLADSGIAQRRTVHVLDPNNPSHTTGFNPLALPEGHDPAVVAEAGLEAFQRLWADEDPDSKPTIQRLLPAVLTVLSERGLTLAEALAVLDPDDKDGIRDLLLHEVQDDYAREELQWLKDMGADKAGRRDLRIEVVGPRNRIAKLLRASAIRTMVGQTERSIDLREAMDDSHIILANLSGGPRVYEQGADLLGRLLVRFLAFHAKRRQHPDRAFGVYLDECQRYLSGDVPVILAELRKQGVMMLLAHQWSSQLSKVDEEILSAVRNATNIKAVFRVKDPTEAAELAEAVMPLNLETPIEALKKETVVGYELRHLRNGSTAQNTTHTTSTAKTKTRGAGTTLTKGESVGKATTTTESEQDSWAHTEGHNHSVSLGQQHATSIGRNHTESTGDSESHGTTTTQGTSRNHGGSRNEQLSSSAGWSETRGGGRSEQDSRSSGWSSSRGGSSSEQDSRSRGANFSESFDVDVDPWRSGERLYARAVVWGEGSNRNVTAGYDSARAHNSGSSKDWSDGESGNETHATGISRNWSDGESGSETHATGNSSDWSEGDSTSEARSLQRGTSHSTADGTSESQSHGTSTIITDGDSESMTHGKAYGTSVAESLSTSQNKSTARSRQRSTAVTRGESVGLGQTFSSGWSEALVPVLAMRPGGVHSKENVLYHAAQTLRSLPTGTCFINWVDRNGMQNALLRVPHLPALPIVGETFDALRHHIFRASPSALPIQEAEQHLAERRRQLLSAAAHHLVKPEPPEPKTFRVPATRRKRPRTGEV